MSTAAEGGVHLSRCRPGGATRRCPVGASGREGALSQTVSGAAGRERQDYGSVGSEILRADGSQGWDQIQLAQYDSGPTERWK